MKRDEIKIGDLVVLKGYEEDLGIGLVIDTVTTGFNGQKDVSGIGDQTVYDIRMVDNLKLWTFTGHELAYIAEKV